MTFQPRTAIVPIFLVLCILMGGASAAGYMANMLLQLAAIGITAWALLTERRTVIQRPGRHLLVLMVLMFLLIALQLVPLPPGLWTILPGRAEAQAGYDLLGLTLPWLPLSLAPDRSIASALWLLPAIAILLAILRAGAYRPDLIAGSLILVTVVAIALGAVQRSGNTAAYIYEITNRGMGTGFFSNGNHMATLLMASIPFAAALYLAARSKSRSQSRTSGLLVILVGMLVVLSVGIVINGSLAGLGLTVPVLCASGLMILGRKRRIPVWTALPIALLTLIGIVLVFTAPLGNDLTSTGLPDPSISRRTFYANTVRAIADFLPFGSGIGSFQSVYPLYEDQAIITTTYANHAHSDLLELLLETGVPGMILLAAFLLWWMRRAVLIWMAEEVDPFARAATIASAAILGHSLVDYPLRTAAISAVFAACCALMAEPRPWVRQRDDDMRKARHLSAE